MNNTVGKLNQINLMDVLSEHLSQNRSLSSYSITRGLNTILNLFWKITWTSVSLFKIFNYNSVQNLSWQEIIINDYLLFKKIYIEADLGLLHVQVNKKKELNKKK